MNLLNGTTTNLKTVLKTSDAGDPPLELDQLSTGPILKAFQGGVLKAQISNAGNLLFNQSGGFIGDQNGNEYLKFATVASAVNELEISNAAAAGRPKIALTGGDANVGLDISPKGTGQVFFTGSSPVRLPTGVAPSNDDDAARKKYVDDRRVSFSATFVISDPSTPSVGFGHFGALIVPAGGVFTVTKIKVIYNTGSHTAGGSVSFQVFRLGTGALGTVTLDNTNNTSDTIYTSDIADVELPENTVLIAIISARSGTITETGVSVIAEGFRTVF